MLQATHAGRATIGTQASLTPGPPSAQCPGPARLSPGPRSRGAPWPSSRPSGSTHPLADRGVLDGQLITLRTALGQQVLHTGQFLLQQLVLLLQ